MGDGADFTSYLVARWPALVRTLVLLDSARAEAEEVAVEAMSRCAPGFDRARREGDVDAWVYRTLLDTRSRHRQRDVVAAAPASAPVAVTDTTIPDLERRIVLLRTLEERLAALPADERETVVLRHVAELDAGQVADVQRVALPVVEARLGRWPRPEEFHDAAEAIPLRAAPVEQVAGRVRDRQRRRTRWGAAAVAGTLVVGLGAWWVSHPSQPGLPEGVVTVADNPADMAWYAGGVLHLSRVTVELPQITEMVEVPDGVVYADTAGRVVLVDADGKLTLLGRTEQSTHLVGSLERGWVAWMDVSGDRPTLVVHDTLARSEVARMSVSAAVRLVALDQGRVYLVEDGESWSWSLPVGELMHESDDELADVASAVRVTQFSDTSLLISQPLFDIAVTVPGEDAMLSPDGDLLLTRVDFNLPDEVRIYEAGSGDVIDSGLAHEEVALAAAFGPGSSITYVVAIREHAPKGGDYVRLSETGPHVLRTCDLNLGTCETVSTLENDTGVAVLPH